ncbi:MAG: GNAT family N-acetyltransferase [Anaerolineae bacterium]|nr:GNAT family N-acetyltransferase [Anaerolineae bacterium]
MNIKTIDTDRLIIRPFIHTDLDTIHPLLNEAFDSDMSRKSRQRWLHWAIANYHELAALGQPPYGDRAITLAESGEVIGVIGLVPSYQPFDTLPYFGGAATGLYTPEIGLFWALGTAYRGHGYATEAAHALCDHAFRVLHLKRIIATTEHDNLASQRVMTRLGMVIQRNPNSEPIWFQTVGILENPLLTEHMKDQSHA